MVEMIRLKQIQIKMQLDLNLDFHIHQLSFRHQKRLVNKQTHLHCAQMKWW